MVSASPDSSLQTYATYGDAEIIHPRAWEHPNTGTEDSIKVLIAKLFLRRSRVKKLSDHRMSYPKGMCAIGTVARSLAPISTHSSEVVTFG